MQAFFKELSEKAEGELSETELDMVAGGKTATTGLLISIIGLGIGCALMSAVKGNDCAAFMGKSFT